MGTCKDTAGTPSPAQHSVHVLPLPGLCLALLPFSLPSSRRDLHLAQLKSELICKTGKSKWFSSIRSQGYGRTQSEAAQHMMFSNENTFPLGLFLYLAEKHSKDICWCSSARQQSLQTEVALFSEEHIIVYRPRCKPNRSTSLTHPLPSTTILQSSEPGSQAPTPLEQDDFTSLCLHCTHKYCYSQPDPSVLQNADKTRDVGDNQTADAAEMN